MVMQIRRTQTTGSAGEPTGLQPGQLAVQMVVAAPKLWVGVPAAVGAPANRLLLAEGAVSGAYMPLTGGTLTNTLSVGTGLTAPIGGAQAGDLNARRLFVNGVSVLTLSGGTLNGSLTVGSPQAPSAGMQAGDLNVQRIYVGGQPLSAPGSYLALAGGTISGTSPGTLTINRNPAPPPPVIGAASAPLHIIGNDNENPVMQFAAFNTLCALRLVRANGTGQNPTRINKDDGLGNIAWEGYWGTTVPPAGGWAGSSARINAFALETFTDVAWGTAIQITTTPIGQTATQIQAIFGPGLTVGEPNPPAAGMQIGDLNARQIYVDGQPLSGPGAYVPNDRASTITGDADLLTLHTPGYGAFNRLIFDQPQSTAGPRKWSIGVGSGGNFNVWDQIRPEGDAAILSIHETSAEFRLHAGNLNFFNSNVDWQYITRTAGRPNLAFCVDNPIDGPLQWFKVIANNSHFSGDMRVERQIHANRVYAWDNEYPGHVAGDNPLMVYADAGHNARIEYYVGGQRIWQVGEGAGGNWVIGEGQSQAGDFSNRVTVWAWNGQIDFTGNNSHVVFNTPVYANNGTTLHNHLWVVGDDPLHLDNFGGGQWARITYANNWSTWKAGLDPYGDFRISDEGGYGYGQIGYRFSINRNNGPIELAGPVFCSHIVVAQGHDGVGWGLIASHGIHANGNGYFAGTVTIGNHLNMSGNISCNFVTTNEMYANGGTSSFHNLAARGSLSVGWGLTVDGGMNLHGGMTTNAAISCHVGEHGINAAGVHIYSGRLWVDNCIDCRTDSSARILNNDWYVNGRIDASGGVSDVRAKRDIEDWSGGLAIIEQLRPVQYHLIHDGQFRHGLVAQEVEPLLPEAVYECSFNGMKHIEYDEITTALVDAVRELSERLKAAEDTIHRLTRSIH